MPPVTLFSDEIFLDHRTPPGHPERPERLRVLTAHLQRSPIADLLRWRRPGAIDLERLSAVHTVRSYRMDPADVRTGRRDAR